MTFIPVKLFDVIIFAPILIFIPIFIKINLNSFDKIIISFGLFSFFLNGHNLLFTNEIDDFYWILVYLLIIFIIFFF